MIILKQGLYSGDREEFNEISALLRERTNKFVVHLKASYTEAICKVKKFSIDFSQEKENARVPLAGISS